MSVDLVGDAINARSRSPPDTRHSDVKVLLSEKAVPRGTFSEESIVMGECARDGGEEGGLGKGGGGAGPKKTERGGGRVEVNGIV